MATWDDVRRIVAALPETVERSSDGVLQWRVRDKLYAWERPLRRADLDARQIAQASTIVGRQMVMAERVAELEPNGSTIHILHLAALRRLDAAQPKSIDELAREQGVAPVRSIDALRGAPLGDMEEFLAALRSARGEGEPE